jgi:hypothetical protein
MVWLVVCSAKYLVPLAGSLAPFGRILLGMGIE